MTLDVTVPVRMDAELAAMLDALCADRTLWTVDDRLQAVTRSTVVRVLIRDAYENLTARTVPDQGYPASWRRRDR